MDISARVMEETVPQAGDHSMPVGMAIGALALCGVLLTVLLRRRGLNQ